MWQWLRAAAILACALASSIAHSHAVLKGSSPASDSVVARSPERISLVFHELTMLTFLAVVSPAGERHLTFAPVGVATEFTASAPLLAEGRNEVQWRAQSRDGHVVEGTIIIVVSPPAS